MIQRVFVSLVLVAIIIPSPVARALDDSALLLTDEQIGLIRTNCVAAQSTMTRIHANDALMWVNLSQQFNAIGSRLMAPLNSRIAANKLDGIDLAQTTVDYTKEVEEFRAVYRDYEQTMSDALQVDCRNQPVGFYDSVALIREKRVAVHESVKKLQAFVQQYRTQFDEFRARVEQQKAAKR